MIIAAIALQAAWPSTYDYEVLRAKQRLEEYGPKTYREERIHRRRGEQGSSIETFCSVATGRTDEGRVQSEYFYWVVSVKPAVGYLSDYERGTWSTTPIALNGKPPNSGDYLKLCDEEEVLDDTNLLSSETHTSSGSVYNPANESVTIVSSEWLIGSWVIGESCATSLDYDFQTGGVLKTYDGVGTWTLRGNKLNLVVTSKYDDDLINRRDLERPETEVLDIHRTGIDAATIGTSYLIRC